MSSSVQPPLPGNEHNLKNKIIIFSQIDKFNIKSDSDCPHQCLEIFDKFDKSKVKFVCYQTLTLTPGLDFKSSAQWLLQFFVQCSIYSFTPIPRSSDAV